MNPGKNLERRGGIDWAAIHERLANLTELGPPSAEQTKRILDERARRLAAVPVPSTPVDALDVLTFSLGRERYAIEARYVVEIARLVDIAVVPGSPSQLVGVTNLRGNILPVFDVGKLIGVTRPGLTDQARLVVLGRDDPDFAIAVDLVGDFRLLAGAEVLATPESMRGPAGPILRGVTTEALLVLDGAALLEDPRLFIDSPKAQEPSNLARQT
jgi:purine-binding chemotaxis protein CheW